MFYLRPFVRFCMSFHMMSQAGIMHKRLHSKTKMNII